MIEILKIIFLKLIEEYFFYKNLGIFQNSQTFPTFLKNLRFKLLSE
jgi:hypothetical protein